MTHFITHTILPKPVFPILEWTVIAFSKIRDVLSEVDEMEKNILGEVSSSQISSKNN